MMKILRSIAISLLLTHGLIGIAQAATPATTRVPIQLIDASACSTSGGMLLGIANGASPPLAAQCVILGTNLSLTGSTLNAAGGSSSGLVVGAGATAISGGATGKVLFDSAGSLAEYAINGTGSVVMTTSPTLVTPTLGVASATTINKVTITAPATGSTLTVADGKTLTDTSGVGASILLGATGGGFAAYGGATCTNQALTVLSAAGAGTCASITNSFLTAGSFTNITTVGTLTSLIVSGNVQFTGISGGVVAFALCTDAGGNLVPNSSANCYAGGAAGAGGSNTNLQYNSGGVLAGNGAATYNGSGVITLGTAGSVIGSLALLNASAGFSATISPPTGALGALSYTLPGATGILATKADIATALPSTSSLYMGTGGAGVAQAVTVDPTLTLSGTTIACTTATSSQIGCIKPDGTIITISAGTITVAKASSSLFGVAKVDNTTITASAGVISVGSISGAAITSGVVGQAYGGAGTISGALKGNGSGTVSQAACADLSNGGTACAAATGTSGATLPYLNGTNTFSGAQTFGTVYGTVTSQSGTTYTLAAADCGTEIAFTNASAVTVTIPAALTTGCNIAILQTTSAGQVSVNGSAVSAATLHSAHSYTKTSGQWAIIGVNIYTTGVAILTGDGA